MLLPNPILCPKEIYDLMCECWHCNEADRPTFKEIHMFLMRKNLGMSILFLRLILWLIIHRMIHRIRSEDQLMKTSLT